MKKLRGILTLLVFLLVSAIAESGANQKISVAFLNPGTYGSPKEYWWNLCSDFMQAAASDLGIELQIFYANRNRNLILQQARDVMLGSDKPDFIVMQNLKQSALPILRLAHAHDVKVLLFNSGLSKETTLQYGGPRESFPNWIGQILPDDEAAGYLQASALIDQAWKMGLTNANGKVQMIATAGVLSDTSARERDRGLMACLAERPEQVTLSRAHALPANWDRAQSRKVLSAALREYPHTTVVWNANDSQALGALDAVQAIAGKTPGQNVLIAGIDWNPKNLAHIESGDILASVGGHFVDGVWAMVLIYDYANGLDFASEGVRFTTQMTLVHSENLASYRKYLQQRDRKYIEQINYKAFSKKHNPDRKEYHFDTRAILPQLTTPP